MHFSDNHMNDIRFDLRPNTTTSGKEIAYIIDSSDEARPGVFHDRLMDRGVLKPIDVASECVAGG